MNSFTIDQCVEQINARLAQEGLPATMNVRLLRHYQQNKSIPAPTQEGRFAKYSNEHVEAGVALRKAQDLGVSSKAYSTISNIEKHPDPTATVASLNLDTPSWMGSSLVGSVSASNATPDVSGSIFASLPTMETAAPKNTVQAFALPQVSSKKISARHSITAAANASSAQETSDPRSAALRALQELGTPAASRTMQPVQTLANIHRAVKAPTMYASAAGPQANVSSPPAPVARDVTEWTLAHDVCVQIPTAARNGFTPSKLQAFEAWMAQLPDLS